VKLVPEGRDNSVSRVNANQTAGKMFPRRAELMGDLSTVVAQHAHLPTRRSDQLLSAPLWDAGRL
jgi:hypothetical protein